MREQVEALSHLRAVESRRLHDQVLEGRQIAHRVRNELQSVVNTLEMMRAEGTMPEPHLREIDEAVTRLEAVADLVTRLHALVRGLEPTA